MKRGPLSAVEAAVVGCRRLPRLVTRREEAADDSRAVPGAAYWARPVPGFGDPAARVFVLGLATAAHGGNRTGRAFTGNPSADSLMPAMHRAGFASRATSEHRGDGLHLDGAWMASVVRCPPPGNRPTPGERDRCLPYLRAEVAALPALRVIVALGGWTWSAVLKAFDAPPRPRFGHDAEHRLPAGPLLLGCYHPSRQNTATGVLTAPMLDDVLGRARELADA